MSYENTSLRCHNCRYWWPLADGQPSEHLRQHARRGQCRRNPPPAGSVELEWAIVLRNDWCGEHSHVEV